MEKSEMPLVLVSNRLPLILKRQDSGWKVHPGVGGLVSALNPVLKARGGSWTGWLGTAEKVDLKGVLGDAAKTFGYSFHPVTLTKKELEGYYHGFSNEILWPLFHSFETRCNFDPGYWRSYCNVNRKFAETVMANSDESDYVWVQDYQLMRVGHYMKELGHNGKVGFFLHIPFPPPDVFLKLPWRAEILQSLMDYDLVGVHTWNDRRNLIAALRRVRLPGLKVSGKGAVRQISAENREVRIGAFPISIDFKSFAKLAGTKNVSDDSWFFHEAIPERQIVLGVDRLDYTKGIPERIEAFGNAMLRYPQMRGKVILVQVVVPSRTGVPEYEALKARIERLVSGINGRFGVPGWTPIQYFYRSLPRERLVAYYRAAEIALVTPLRDGMNLIAKEYCACCLEERGVLILSEFAGAAAEMKKHALLVNPYDTEGVADALYHAFRMPEEEKRMRMRRLRALVRKYDIFYWVEKFLNAALSSMPDVATHVEEYIPSVKI